MCIRDSKIPNYRKKMQTLIRWKIFKDWNEDENTQPFGEPVIEANLKEIIDKVFEDVQSKVSYRLDLLGRRIDLFYEIFVNDDDDEEDEEKHPKDHLLKLRSRNLTEVGLQQRYDEPDLILSKEKRE
eukprot:TRINITY_DN13653_c0_g1_i1.p1 TRINITY_DN13653_c0_g1~~TRINITY_DN13653_c0_g1_i1.p1  ORF type:complete len:146 (-),score=38.85 TRINITY_DN13653_c0_g1_i1:125-505(-)